MEKEKYLELVVKLTKGTIKWNELQELATYEVYSLPTVPEAVKLGFSNPSKYSSYNSKFEKSMIYLKKQVVLKAELLTASIELKEVRKEQYTLVTELKALNECDNITELRRLSKLEVLNQEENTRMQDLGLEIQDLNNDIKDIKEELKKVAILKEIKHSTRGKRPSLMDRLGQ